MALCIRLFLGAGGQVLISVFCTENSSYGGHGQNFGVAGGVGAATVVVVMGVELLQVERAKLVVSVTKIMQAITVTVVVTLAMAVMVKILVLLGVQAQGMVDSLVKEATEMAEMAEVETVVVEETAD